MKRYLHDIVIAFEAILANKLKSLLTALGIIFGVAAVITMLAIGNGGKQEILADPQARNWYNMLQAGNVAQFSNEFLVAFGKGEVPGQMNANKIFLSGYVQMHSHSVFPFHFQLRLDRNLRPNF